MIVSLQLHAQESKINWVSFEELTSLYKEEQRPILVFIHADWCKYCKMQEAKTFKNEELVQKLNDEFYALRLNGESKETITFFGREYPFNTEEGFNSLASFLGKEEGQLNFPTTLLLNSSLIPVFKTNSFISAAELTQALSAN